MPELPEVETTRRGLAPLAEGLRIEALVVRQPRLRWPIPNQVEQAVGQEVIALERRAKWLIWRLEQGHLLWHLGMSGSFRAWSETPQPGPHDHVDTAMAAGHTIRYTDPRRFGALLWCAGNPLDHPRLVGLGPEPFEPAFNGQYLFSRSRGRRVTIKGLIMDGQVVVGVGNIYACESLFAAGIHPGRAAGRIGHKRYDRLADAIERILGEAIEVGGTSLRDFTAGDGTPGYFGQALKVYGREGAPCLTCGRPVRRIVIGQRSTFFCSGCQT